ncbi:PA4642 family protein [Moraxella sp. ZY210820]|uniref:PA4642 family protein n=1 Tax=unclassified Moraxella TaxID=2685852 RepID=UPI002730A6DD|nr:PA4642 family protein [Moraxella sp. ZY210820]WLF82972.1 PA4642 family protein [Moraxella sp. ZY210820]
MAVSQPATFNEAWSDERVFAYLNQLPPNGVDADFHVLYHAFKHMRSTDYERLLKKFIADGRDVNATNAQGQRIHDVIAQHSRQKDDFLAVLAQFSA